MRLFSTMYNFVLINSNKSMLEHCMPGSWCKCLSRINFIWSSEDPGGWLFSWHTWEHIRGLELHCPGHNGRGSRTMWYHSFALTEGWCRDWLGSHGLALLTSSPWWTRNEEIPFSGVLATWWNCVQAIVMRAIMNTNGQVSTTWWHTEKAAQQDGKYVSLNTSIAPWTRVCKC